MKVLLLEDKMELQRTTTRMIKRAYPAADVQVTARCSETIAAIQLEDFDLVVCDFEVLDGKSDRVLAWVRDHEPELLHRFVFFSGSPEPTKLHDKYISKGCHLDEFVEQMHKFVPA